MKSELESPCQEWERVRAGIMGRGTVDLRMTIMDGVIKE